MKPENKLCAMHGFRDFLHAAHVFETTAVLIKREKDRKWPSVNQGIHVGTWTDDEVQSILVPTSNQVIVAVSKNYKIMGAWSSSSWFLGHVAISLERAFAWTEDKRS